MSLLNNYVPNYSAIPNYIQQPLLQAQPQTPNVQTNNSNGITWVQGKEAAKAYPIARNTSMTLFDSEGDYFYIKSTDASGMPLKLRTFSYSEIADDTQENIPTANPKSQEINTEIFATKEDLQRTNNALESLAQQVSALNESKQSTTKQKRIIDTKE